MTLELTLDAHPGYWMSDKPLVQQALAQNLADLTLDVRPRSKTRNGRVERFRSALAFLRGFWEAIVREWSTLDHHRCALFLGVLLPGVADSFGRHARAASTSSCS